jgi:hypothetical protein
MRSISHLLPSTRKAAVVGPVTVLIAAAAALSGSTSAFAANPTSNYTPPYPWAGVCTTGNSNGNTCIDTLLEDIDAAHKTEGRADMHLPTGFSNLTQSQQLFVITNLERVARGEQPVTGTSEQIATAEASLASSESENHTWVDVPGMGGNGEGYGEFASGVVSPLIADYIWMYQDGWGGAGHTPNGDCTGPTAPKCWGHRDAILYIEQDPSYNVNAGGGGESSNGSNTYDYLTEWAQKTGTVSYSYLWTTAVANGASD